MCMLPERCGIELLNHVSICMLVCTPCNKRISLHVPPSLCIDCKYIETCDNGTSGWYAKTTFKIRYPKYLISYDDIRTYVMYSLLTAVMVFHMSYNVMLSYTQCILPVLTVTNLHYLTCVGLNKPR